MSQPTHYLMILDPHDVLESNGNYKFVEVFEGDWSDISDLGTSSFKEAQSILEDLAESWDLPIWSGGF
jgi:hypothetical protein